MITGFTIRMSQAERDKNWEDSRKRFAGADVKTTEKEKDWICNGIVATFFNEHLFERVDEVLARRLQDVLGIYQNKESELGNIFTLTATLEKFDKGSKIVVKYNDEIICTLDSEKQYNLYTYAA